MIDRVEDFAKLYWKSPSMKSETINYIYYMNDLLSPIEEDVEEEEEDELEL